MNSISAFDDEAIVNLIQSEVGFSGEIKAHHRLIAAGYDVWPSPYYEDQETSKEREIDLIWTGRSKNIRSKERRLTEVSFICDVKTSSAPTIIFCSEPTVWDSGNACVPFFFQQLSENEPTETKCAAYENTVFAGAFSHPRVGRMPVKLLSSVERSTKNRVETNFYRESMFSTVKGALHFWEEQQRSDILAFQKLKEHVKLFVPVVLIDGPLKEFYYDSDQPHLKDVSFRLVRFDAVIQKKPPFHEVLNGKTRSYAVLFCQIDKVVEMTKQCERWISQRSFQLWLTAISQGHNFWQRIV